MINANSKVFNTARLWLIKRSSWLLVFFVFLAVVGSYYGSKVQLKLSLTDLLPEHHPAVVKFNQLTEVVGGVGFFTIVLNAEDGKSHLEIAPQLIEKLKTSSFVRSVTYHREKRFFVDRMLYYSDLDKLEELEKNISKQIIKSRRKAFDIGLWDDEEKKEPAKEASIFDNTLKEQAQNSAGISPYLTSKDKKHLLIMVKPSFDSSDLTNIRELVSFSEKVLKETLPPNVTYDFTERYYNKMVETDLIQWDIFFLGFLSIVFIAAVLWAYLRSIRALAVIFIPVFIGLGITMGLTYAYIGHINIITGFLVGILSGLGVDYGIHLLLRIRLEKKEPSSADPDPVWRTLLSSGHSVFVGAVAAAFTFYLLCFSSFKAFSEFGFVCGTGILAVFISLICTFAALVKIFGEGKEKTFSKSRQFPVLSLPRGFTVALVATAIIAILGYKVGFEYDLDRMMQHSQKMEELSSLVDNIYERSAVPSAVAIQDKAEALAIEKYIKDKYVPSLVSDMISGASIVPEKQVQKHEVLLKIEKELTGIKDRWIEKSLDVPGSAVRTWVAAKPFTFTDIPSHIQDALRGTSQSGYLIYLYPAIKLGDAHSIRKYASMIRDIETKFPNALTGSDTVIFSDILDLIHHDGLIILLVIFVAVGLFIWINVRDFEDTLLSYIPLILALPVGMGLMYVFGIRFNIFNISIIPTFVAMGIDVPIHLVHRAKEIRSGYKAVRDLAASIHLALLTAGVGFGVLIFAKAGILKSLGWIALLGSVAIWWVGIVLLPAFLEWYYRKNNHQKSIERVELASSR